MEKAFPVVLSKYLAPELSTCSKTPSFLPFKLALLAFPMKMGGVTPSLVKSSF